MIRLLCFCICLSLFFLTSSKADGDDIAATFTPPPPPGIFNPNQNKAPLKPSIAIIVGVLTTVFSITFLILLYVKHCKTGNSGYPSNSRGLATAYTARKNSGINRKVIDMLPVFRFGSLRGQKDGLECAVCLSSYEAAEVLRLLPKCKHAFHVECVDTWLDAHSTCPLCRYQVDPEDVLLIENNKSIPQQDQPQKQQVQEEESVPEIHRISGRHSSAGETGSHIRSYLQVIVSKPPNETMGSRRSLDSSMRSKKETGSVSTGCFDRPRKDDLLLAVKENSDRRFQHRIVVSSSDRNHRQRWSDVQTSDLLYIRSEMLMSDSRRVSASSASPAGQRQNQKWVSGNNEDEKEEETRREKGGKMTLMEGRSVSEITGMSRRRSNEVQQQRQRQQEGFVSRWLAWISDTNPAPRSPAPPSRPAVSNSGRQASSLSPQCPHQHYQN